jgi:hypothetical protein
MFNFNLEVKLKKKKLTFFGENQKINKKITNYDSNFRTS